MSALTPDEVRKHVKIYIAVFIALAVLTCLTVGVSYLHLAVLPAIAAALTIAIVKGSLVAGFFMHLTWEKRIIFLLLIGTVFFFAFLLIFPAVSSG